MKVKLKDLAQLCSVDASTVLRAIKNDPRISKETTERVQKVARKMGYQPNLAAGAVINCRDIKDVSAVRRLLEMNFPVVFIDVPVNSLDACVITTDNRRASAGLTEQCLNEGVEEFILLL